MPPVQPSIALSLSLKKSTATTSKQVRCTTERTSGARKGKDPFSTGSLIAPSPAHGNRAMLARGDFFNNMKAPRVVANVSQWSG
ncbi:TPA: hypothetical protein ACH3X3_004032 [Trebouxia sp. C0006]